MQIQIANLPWQLSNLTCNQRSFIGELPGWLSGSLGWKLTELEKYDAA